MTDKTTQIIGLIAIVLGVLIFIYPNLVAYLIGIFLVIFGVLEIIK
ncbi:MAG: hypothetical protein Q4Q23_05885 [Methanobacteriaceae archaeon]|nr:hypothetical protein [Methanobacteriaceae archaeon]